MPTNKLSDSVMDHLTSDARHDRTAIPVFCGTYFCVKAIEEGADPSSAVAQYLPLMLPLAQMYKIDAEFAIQRFFDYMLMDQKLFGL